MNKISLDEYRSEGVRVFSGERRGKAVAEAILEEYGRIVQITVPDDVFHIGRNFRRGFNKVLPNVKIPKL